MIGEKLILHQFFFQLFFFHHPVKSWPCIDLHLIFNLQTLILILACIKNQAGGDGEAEPEIRQMESRRIQAMLRVDAEELNRVLADDLTYVHSSGQVDSKAQLIASLQYIEDAGEPVGVLISLRDYE